MSAARTALIMTLAATVLVGCGTSGSSEAEQDPARRGAAPEESVAGTRPPVGAGVWVCVRNRTDRAPRATFVLYSKVEGAVSRTLARGDVACGGGRSTSGDDVQVEVRTPDVRHSVRIDGRKPAIGPPWVRISQLYNKYCTSAVALADGEERVWDDGVLRWTFRELPDDGDDWPWSFEVDIDESLSLIHI